jgi:hypothetical protein
MDLTQALIIAAAVTAICTAVLQVMGVLGKVASGIGGAWNHLFNSHAASGNIPTRTVVMVKDARLNALFWGTSQVANKKFLQVVGDFRVTNVWTSNVTLVAAKLRTPKWFFFRQVTEGDAMVKDLKSVYTGHYPIPAGAMTDLRVHFMTVPHNGRKPGVLVADLAVIDQFGNHHWIKGLRFKHPEKMF